MQDRKKIENDVFKMVKENDLEGVQAAIQNYPWLLQSTQGFNSSLLSTACWNDKPEMAELLIKLGADVNGKPGHESPLSQALYVKAGVKTINILLAAKADVSHISLYQAHSQINILNALLKAGVRNRAAEVFCTAVMDGNEELVDLLLSYGVSVNSSDEDQKPLLMWAACNRSDESHFRIAQKLLSKGANVNQKNKWGQTPLYWAVSCRFTMHPLFALSNLYLNAGAKLDAIDDHGVTPFLYAAQESELTMIEILLSRSPDIIKHRDHDNNTALHFAAENHREDVCQYFIDKGLNCNAVNKKGNTPLHYACSQHNYVNIYALVKAGANTNSINDEGKTPLDLMKKHPNFSDSKYEECIKYLEQQEVWEKFSHLDPSFESCLGRFEITPAMHKSKCISLIRRGEKNVVKSLDTALELLIDDNHRYLHLPAITEAVLEYIRHMDDREFELLEKRNAKYPFVSDFVSNVKFVSKYFGLTIQNILPHVDEHYLSSNIQDHLKKSEKLCDKLQELTNLTWQFKGTHYKSEKAYDWYPREPRHPKKYSNVVTRVLVARGMLSGEKSGLDSSFSDDSYRWTCKIPNVEALLKLDAKQLSDDIEKASRLIAQITGESCVFLHIHPVDDASYFKVLEMIGCIKVDEYYAFNAQAIDFDLAKLQRLKDENITMAQLWTRYKKADPSQPLFEQICKSQNKFANPEPTLSQLFKKPEVFVFDSSIESKPSQNTLRK